MDITSLSTNFLKKFADDVNKELSKTDPEISTEERISFIKETWKSLPKMWKKYYIDMENNWVEH